MNPKIEAFLRVLIAAKPKRLPEWGEDCGGNRDDHESNGYAICAWHTAEAAEKLLCELSQ